MKKIGRLEVKFSLKVKGQTLNLDDEVQNVLSGLVDDEASIDGAVRRASVSNDEFLTV